MIRGLHRYLAVTAVALILTGCINRGEQPAPVEEAKPGVEQPAQPEPTVPTVPTVPTQPGPVEQPEPTIPAQPKVRTYDWNSAMQPMVGKMLQADGVTPGSVLLVDSVNNRTNGSLQTSSATEALRGALANNNNLRDMSKRVSRHCNAAMGLQLYWPVATPLVGA